MQHPVDWRPVYAAALLANNTAAALLASNTVFCSGRGGHSYTRARAPNSRNSPIQVTLEKSALTENRCAVRHVRGASMYNSYASVWPVLSSYRLWTSSSLSSW